MEKLAAIAKELAESTADDVEYLASIDKAIAKLERLRKNTIARVEKATSKHSEKYKLELFCEYLIKYLECSGASESVEDAPDNEDSCCEYIFLVPWTIPSGVDMEELGFIKSETPFTIKMMSEDDMTDDYQGEWSADISMVHLKTDKVDAVYLQDGEVWDEFTDKQLKTLLKYQVSCEHIMNDLQELRTVTTSLPVYTPPPTCGECREVRKKILALISN